MNKYILYILFFLYFPFSLWASKPAGKGDVEAVVKSKFESALQSTRSGYHITAFKDWIDYMELAQKYPDATSTQELQTAYIALATIHFNFQDYESSLDFNLRGLQLAENTNDKKAIIRFLNNMVGCYAETGDFDKAQEANVRMRDLSKALGTNDYDYNFEFNAGYISKKKGDYDDAIAHYLNSLHFLKNEKVDNGKLAYPYSELFSVYELTENLDSALYYLLKYQAYADKPYLQKDCYKELMRIYAKLGDNKKCLDSQLAYFHITDSVLNEREFIEIRNQYQNREKALREGHITDLEVKLTRQGFVLAIVGIALLFIIIVAWLIWRQKKRLDTAYAGLYDKNKELLKIHSELVQERKKYRIAMEKESAEPAESSEENIPKEDTCVASEENLPDNEVKSELLAKIQDIFDLTEEYLNPEFSLQSLAKMVGSNTKYVSQAINDALECNFRSLVNEYRIKEAQRRMLDSAKYGNMTIQGIAESVGYKSPTNFIAAFKKITGMTPSLFMKISKERNPDS